MAEIINEFTRVVEPETKRMGWAERLMSLFVSPVQLMKNIKAYPAVLIPLIVVSILSLSALPLLFRYTDIQMQWFSNISLERYGVDYFNLAAMEDVDMGMSVSQITRISSAASAVVSYPISAFMSALGVWIITKIARGQAKLGQYFSMYLHLSIIQAIGVIILYALCLALDTTLDVTSLAAVFMPLGNITMPLYNLLSTVTVFSLWITVLSGIGIKIINDYSTRKAVIVTAVAYLFAIGLATATLSSTFLAYDFLNNML